MGGSYSHELCQATPPKEDKFQKHLPIDPRSPSTDITRTPIIIVDKTPEGALDPALDPRSPTAGIYRTPLTSLPGSKEGTGVESQTSTISQFNLDTNIFPEVNPEEGAGVSMEDDELDPLAAVDLQSLSLDELPTDESTRLMDIIPIMETEKRPKKSVKVAQPKELFPNKKGIGLRESTRSPLSMRNVDMNSPLQIIQRKQTSKVVKAGNCSSESPTARFIVKDKENM